MSIPFSLANIGARAMSALDPEQAHRLTVAMMAMGMGPKLNNDLSASAILKTDIAGIEFPNPLGLAAGFDKNAQAANGMLNLGFGFVEVGAVTPRPQFGNERPRVFRLRADKAVINRYGFNNDGVEAMAARLANPRAGIVGVNLGANKDSDDRTEDFVLGLRRLDGLADFFTVNISSPNTPGLRALQGKAALFDLLTRVIHAREKLHHKAPVFLKIAPDLTDEDKADIVACVRECGIDGLIISNTTIERPATLQSESIDEMGGLSGAPLFERSTALLAEFYQVLGADVPLIGVGGVSSPRQAYEKIRAGASLVQLYTALIYEGPGLVRDILKELPDYLRADGFSAVSEAVGAR